jgi:diguanylate cyclase (GGDEF)-like protein
VPVDETGAVHVTWSKRQGALYRASDVLAGRVPPSTFNGKLVFVGYMVHGLPSQEILRTPNGLCHGVLIHAAVARTALTHGFLWDLRAPVGMLLLITFSVALAIVFPRVPPKRAAAWAGGLAAGYGILWAAALLAIRISLPLTAPVCLVLTSVGARLLVRLHKAIEDATTDPLTGLVNRRGAMEVMGRTLQRRGGRYTHSLVLVDVDNFATFNNLHGHPAGDAVLVRVAQVLRQAFPGGLVARLGGDEFMVFLAGVTPTEAAAMAEKARTGLHMDFTDREVTLSLGIAAFPYDGNTISTLLRAADEALYAAKRGGRDRACILDRSPAGDLIEVTP